MGNLLPEKQINHFQIFFLIDWGRSATATLQSCAFLNTHLPAKFFSHESTYTPLTKLIELWYINLVWRPRCPGGNFSSPRLEDTWRRRVEGRWIRSCKNLPQVTIENSGTAQTNGPKETKHLLSTYPSWTYCVLTPNNRRRMQVVAYLEISIGLPSSLVLAHLLTEIHSPCSAMYRTVAWCETVNNKHDILVPKRRIFFR